MANPLKEAVPPKEVLKVVPPEEKQDVLPNEAQDESELKPAKPHRCSNCNRLIFTGDIGVDGEIKHKCRCGTMNTFKPNVPAQNFQDRIFKNKAHNSK